MNNQELGRSLEEKVCALLRGANYWVKFMNPNKDGSQPCDILAIRGSTAPWAPAPLKVIAIDCKTNKGKRFDLKRIEDNQETSLTYMNKRGIFQTYFLIENEEGMFLHNSQELIRWKRGGIKSVEVNKGVPFQQSLCL